MKIRDGIGEAIIRELSDRRGFRQTLDECDEDIKQEIKESVADAALKGLAECELPPKTTLMAASSGDTQEYFRAIIQSIQNEGE